MEAREIALLAAEAASDKKAGDVVVLDVAQTLVITGYFVIATGTTDRHVRSIADEVEDQLRETAGIKPIGREGEREGRWILLDFADVVVHVFQPDERDFYRLEKLWSDAPRVPLPGDTVEAPEAPAEVAGS
ncbi:MAG: ribosome silencing factor [Coriobacteriia bacterium]